MSGRIKIIPINTHGYGFRLVLKIKVNRPMKLMAKGIDRDHIHTVYFNHTLGNVNVGEHTVKLPMPVTPEWLLLGLYDASTLSSDNIQVISISQEPLNKVTKVITDPYAESFKKFALEISLKAGYMEAGPGYGRGKDQQYYWSNDGLFLMIYSENIYNKKTGEVLITPARVTRDTADMELSKSKFLKMTVPGRYMVILHEFGHHYENTGSEFEADKWAVKQYLEDGFSKNEAVNAYAKVFTDTPMARARLSRIKDYILNYNYTII